MGGGKVAVANRIRMLFETMNRRSVQHTAAALAMCVLLAGCLFTPSKALAPLPEETRADLTAKGLSLGAPLYIRLFKLEAEMEVWMQGASGAYQLFRTYPICNWSGDIGPKIKEGDKQAPEGFYVVTARQMNPNSKYYLSFNIGYPNAYDRSRGYTGSSLMVHGGCRSQGCYAITDEAIQELYILARDAFAQGQRQFPVHAFPFRMTKESMAFRAGHQWYSFWQNLKEGYDIFEQTRLPPVVGVKQQKYVFFADERAIPEDFTTANVNDPLAPRLISGWQH
jgi:murein L,D-transpeptidase YafK